MPTIKSGGKSTTKTTKTTKPTTRAKKGSIGKLVIVESPAKARTIEQYLGAGYTVKASMGHIRDLPKSTMGVDVENDFTPKYPIPRDKSKLVKELKASVAGATEVILATDPDREGEAIAWHLIAGDRRRGQSRSAGSSSTRSLLMPSGRRCCIPAISTCTWSMPSRRGEFSTGSSDTRSVRCSGRRSSAAFQPGACRPPRLRIVVEREREIQAFKPVEYWSLDADLQSGRGDQVADHQGWSAPDRQGESRSSATKSRPRKVVNGSGWREYRVAAVTKRESQRRPQAPFTTSTLQQEASRKLGYNVRRTMQLAQELYEGDRSRVLMAFRV